MLNKNIAIAVAVVLAIVCLAEAREEGPHDMADALRMLQELDRYYTQAARPRYVGLYLEQHFEYKAVHRKEINENDPGDNDLDGSKDLRFIVEMVLTVDVGFDRDNRWTGLIQISSREVSVQQHLARRWDDYKLGISVGGNRIDRRDVADGDRVDPDLLNRAVRLLVLQKLDNIYSYHTRPRFGKRSDAYTNWAKDLEKPDLPAWLAYARRR